MRDRPETLVLGATGKTGRRVADRLEQAGRPVRRASRSGTPAFDWEDPGTWAAALAGVGQVYITYQPDLAVPEALPAMRRFTRLAVASGVGKLVLLSGRGEEGALACEEVVRGSGVDWTIVRASWFAQNFDEGHFLEPILAGTFVMPPVTVAEPFIDIDDIADVAAESLMDDRHVGQVYEVTGPQLIRFEDAIGEIAAASGRELRFLEVPADDYRQGLVAAQVPADFAAFLTELMTTVLDGRNEYVTGDVQRALGRPARTFGDYVRRTARSGAWRVSRPELDERPLVPAGESA